MIWTSVLAMLLLGIAGAVIILSLEDVILTRALHVPPHLRAEAFSAIRILALALPFVTSTSAMTGILAAHQRFDSINAVRTPLGILNLLGPLALLPWRHDLGAVTMVLVLQRIAAALVYLQLVRRTDPRLTHGVSIRPRMLGPLLAFGRWITVSAVIGPFMVYLDRFMIAGILSTAVIAYYTVPFDVLSRIWIISGAITAVLFPAIASSLAVDRSRARALFQVGLTLIYLGLFPVTLGCCLFAGEALRAWLGQDFADHGRIIVQVLSAGMFVNALAQLALVVVHASGRPQVAAWLHATELPLYLLTINLLLHRVGLAGAAVAWAARASVDALVLFVVAIRVLGIPSRTWAPAAGVMVVTLSAFLLTNAPLPVRLGSYGLVLATLGMLTLRSGLIQRTWSALRGPLVSTQRAS